MDDRINSSDWSFLLSRKIEQICFGRYQVQIKLLGGATLCIQSNFEFKSQEIVYPFKSSDYSQSSSNIISILGQKIIKVQPSTNNVLFYIENGDVLVVDVSDTNYESLEAFSQKDHIII